MIDGRSWRPGDTVSVMDEKKQACVEDGKSVYMKYVRSPNEYELTGKKATQLR